MSCTEGPGAGAARLLAIGLAVATAVAQTPPASGPRRGTNPAIQLNQVAAPAPASRKSVGVADVAPRPARGGLAIAPVPTPRAAGPNTQLSQPSTTLDRCEAILQGRSPPIDGLDCNATLERLRQAAAPPPSTTPNIDALSRDLLATQGGGDPTLGAPGVVILAPGR